MRTIGEAGTASAWTGVTICTETYRSRAQIAAEQFVKCTGCPAVILDEEDFEAPRRLVQRTVSGEPALYEVPHTVKLFLFNLLDADRLVYFDADLLFLRPFDPEELPGQDALRVVRDLWWNPGVLSDCAGYRLDVSRYFNGGLLIMQRARHAAWLEEARKIFGSLNAPVFREQTALNAAAQRLDIPIHYLPRDYNVIRGGDTDELGMFAITGLHLLKDFPAAEYDRIVRDYENSGTVCHDPRSTGVAGEWRYERVGRDRRVLEFRPDGTIGRGSEECERYWRVWEQDGETVLGVFGHGGGESRMRLTFGATAKGDEWHGRWERFEQSDVVLRRCSVTHGRGLSIDRLTVAIVTCDRQPRYVDETLASLFASDLLVHALPAVHLVVCGQDAGYLRNYRHHRGIRMHTLSAEEHAAIQDWGVHRKCNHTHWRSLSLPVPDDGGICVLEDDVIFRDGWIEKLLATIDEMENEHDLGDYVLALTTTYDLEEDPSFFRGQRYCSYGYGYYGTQGMYYPAHICAQLREYLHTHGVQDCRNPVDLLIGERFGHCIYACPRSLVHHIGAVSTGLGGGAGSPSFYRPYKLFDRSNWGQRD